MAKLTITIPDAKVELLKNAIGYQDKIINEEGEEVANPQTPEEFIEEQAKEHMNTWFSELMIRNARQSARQQEQETITSIKEQVGQTIDVIET